MKRSIFFLLFLLFSNSVHAINTENNVHILTNENGQKCFSSYACYFIAKEFSKAYIYSYFYDDKNQDNAKIACSQCHYIMTAGKVWTYAVMFVQETLLKDLTYLIYNGSVKELTEFMLATFQEGKIECDKCSKYNGWYIIEQATSL